MRNRKLISMTEFVLEVWRLNTEDTDPCLANTNQLLNMHKYAEFLKQPLKLGMFIPCNIYDDPVKEYIKTTEEIFADENNICRLISKEETSYYIGLKDVIFKGFSVCGRNEKFDCIVNGYLHLTYPFREKTIEDLVKYNLTLTDNAINI